MWFSVNAQLDGVDAGSENPVDRMKYMVYQRRLMLEALKNKAMLLAMVDNKEASAKVAESYIEMAIPASKLVKQQRELAVQQQMEEIEKMGPQQARAVSTAEIMQREAERLARERAKTGDAPKVAPPKNAPQVLTGKALADHLNEQTAKEREARERKRSPVKRPGNPRPPR